MMIILYFFVTVTFLYKCVDLRYSYDMLNCFWTWLFHTHGFQEIILIFVFVNKCCHFNLILYLFNEDCRQPMATSSFPHVVTLKDILYLNNNDQQSAIECLHISDMILKLPIFRGVIAEMVPIFTHSSLKITYFTIICTKF